MQALATQGLRINRRHPDAVGCYFAMPVEERGGETVRDLMWSGSKGLGQPVWTGARAYGNLRRGRAVSVGLGVLVGTPLTGTPWSSDFSVCFTMNASTFATAKGGFIRSGGFAIAHTTGVGTLELHQDNVAVRATSGVALNVNQEYVIGLRYRLSDLNVNIYINGSRETLTAGAAVTTSAFTTATFASFNAQAAVALIRDIRIWNRYMPDATFERYYYKPNDFYQTRPSFLKSGAASFNAGRFFPFLHPALQS
jgi:hypothetical protein